MNQSNELESKDKIVSKLDQILFWLKFANANAVREYFLAILDSDQKIQAYKLSDGKHTINEIMTATSVGSTGTISNWWNEWLDKGIVQESESFKGRKEKVIELSELGL